MGVNVIPGQERAEELLTLQEELGACRAEVQCMQEERRSAESRLQAQKSCEHAHQEKLKETEQVGHRNGWIDGRKGYLWMATGFSPKLSGYLRIFHCCTILTGWYRSVCHQTVGCDD